MKGFLKTFVIGLATMFLIFSGAVISLGLVAGNDLKRVLREYVLSEEEKEAILEARNKVEEPAVIPRAQPESTDEILEALAERVGSNKVNELAEEFRVKLNSLAERESYLEQRYTEMRIAEGDLDRKARLLKRERASIEQERRAFQQSQEAFAQKQIEIVKQVQVIDEVERKQMLAQVKVYEQMKDAAWKSLRPLGPDLIARYLSLMDPKKAAKILSIAEEDEEYPGIGYEISRSWRTIDLDGISGDQTERLADLYVYIKPDKVADMLIEDNNVKEAAKILLAMQAKGGAKKVAPVRVALAEKDELFNNSITQFLDQYEATGAAQ